MVTEQSILQFSKQCEEIFAQIRRDVIGQQEVVEGTVIAMKHGGISETFTVRRVAYGCGVERVFPVHSPNVVAVDVVRHGRVRRAKLYYLRGLTGKAAKIKEKK